MGADAAKLGPASSVIEWGSGGGAVIRAMPKVARYVAVDISWQARDESEACGAEAVDVLAVAALESGTFDCFVSFACFQHFAKLGEADEVLAEARRLLKPTGFGVVHTRYYAPGDRYDPSTLQGGYGSRFNWASAWRQGEFAAVMERHGLHVVETQTDPGPQYEFHRFRVA